MTQSKTPVSSDRSPETVRGLDIVAQVVPIVHKWCTQYDWEESEIESLVKSLEDVVSEDYLNPDGIFQTLELPRGADAKFPMDFYCPNDSDIQAFVMPQEGQTPRRVLEGNEVCIPTFKIGNAISISGDYLRDRRKDVIKRSLKIFLNGFTRKIQDDKMHCLMCGASNNHPEPKSNLKLLVEDFAGRGKTLTHLIISRKAMELMKKESGAGSLAKYPKMSEVDDTTIPTLTGINEVYGINLIVIDGLTDYYYDILNFTAKGHRWYHRLGRWFMKKFGLVKPQKDIMLGIDMTNNASFIHPVRDKLNIFDDPTLGRSLKVGIYGFMENGMGILDQEPLGLACFPFSR